MGFLTSVYIEVDIQKQFRKVCITKHNKLMTQEGFLLEHGIKRKK